MCRIKLTALILSAALLALPFAAAGETADTKVANYKTEEVTAGSYVRTSQAPGTVVFPRTSYVKYEGQTCTFHEFKVRREDHVEAGDVIATVLVEGSDVSLTNASLTLERTREAYEEGREEREKSIREAYDALAGMRQGYDRDMQRLRIRKMESQLAQYCYQQEYSIAQQEENLGELVPDNTLVEVYAPISGVVSNTASLRDDSQVTDGMVLATIYSQDTVLVRVDNPDGYFRYGMEVNITAGNVRNPQQYTGRVVAADNMIPQAQRTYKAYIEMDYDPETVDPSAARNIVAHCDAMRLDNVLIASRTAVVVNGGKNYVTLLEDGMLKTRLVLVGDRSVAGVWIMAGVENGALLVLE